MRYVMLVYMDEKRWGDLSRQEKDRVHRECTAWHDDLATSGQSVGQAGLRPPSTATTLREQNGKLIITDGPFAETREVLGGYEVVECRDLDEAIAVARRFPALRAGLTMEVRPIMEDCMEDDRSQ